MISPVNLTCEAPKSTHQWAESMGALTLCASRRAKGRHPHREPHQKLERCTGRPGKTTSTTKVYIKDSSGMR